MIGSMCVCVSMSYCQYVLEDNAKLIEKTCPLCRFTTVLVDIHSVLLLRLLFCQKIRLVVRPVIGFGSFNSCEG